MIVFAKVLQENSANFALERDYLAADIETVRDDPTLTDSQRRSSLLALHQRLIMIAENEERLTAETVNQCLKAARLGLELRGLLSTYDQLTANDISDGIAFVFDAAGRVSGRDLGALRTRTETIVAELTLTPELNALLGEALGEVKTLLQPAQ